MSRGNVYRQNADKTKRYLAEISDLKAENERLKNDVDRFRNLYEYQVEKGDPSHGRG